MILRNSSWSYAFFICWFNKIETNYQVNGQTLPYRTPLRNCTNCYNCPTDNIQANRQKKKQPTNPQTVTRIDCPTNRLTDLQTDRPTDRRTDRPTDRQTDGLTDRPTNRLIDRPTNRLTETETNKQRQTDKQTNRQKKQTKTITKTETQRVTNLQKWDRLRQVYQELPENHLGTERTTERYIQTTTAWTDRHL